ncbi:expressed conserved protein [Echinococcus multilocularis]|uniref:Expressed conserved protein n=1 Tax=Echinococcus multilocularis TaxID=6211 RepID=A0A068Y0G8_ECHMU|nr:expressed conserved protein [Echinococcus multilocularis]
MFSRLVVRQGYRFPHLLNTLRAFSTASTAPECLDVYVSADRAKFYKSLGVFCLAQGFVWLIFGQYLRLKCGQPVTWEVMKGDVCELSRRLADRLEYWTPDAVAKVIFRSRKAPLVEEKAVKLMEEKVVKVDYAEKAETEKGEKRSDMEILADRMREALGVKTGTANGDEARQKERERSKQLMPYLCFVMGVFTLFVGGFIPRRVIRRVSLVQWKSTQCVPNGRNNPMMRVNTYGWFGLFPRSGALFTTQLSNIRATAEYREGNRFMSLIIAKRPFTFYLERSEAEFILPEYFEHLNSEAISRQYTTAPHYITYQRRTGAPGTQYGKTLQANNRWSVELVLRSHTNT